MNSNLSSQSFEVMRLCFIMVIMVGIITLIDPLLKFLADRLQMEFNCYWPAL